MDAEVVRESTIFAALPQRGFERRQRLPGNTGIYGSTPSDGYADPGSLPLVNSPQDISRPPIQLSSSHVKTPHSLMMSTPITTGECWLVWKFLCDWVKTQLAMEVPASIPSFGTFFMRSQPFGIRMSLFEPDRQFLNRFGLMVDVDLPDVALGTSFPSIIANPTVPEISDTRNTESDVSAEQNLGDIFAFSFREMAACCGNSVDATRAKEWLSAVVQKLGDAMNRCGRVEINIGVGVIVCVDQVIQRRLSSRDSSISPRFEYEVRTGESVVKRNLRAQAALQFRPASKPKSSFLSGSNFSPSIELHPVVDRSKDMPNFSFGPPFPRPPGAASLSVGVGNRSSPRSMQLHKRLQSPLTNRASTSATIAETIVKDNDNHCECDTSAHLKQKEGHWIPPQLFDRLSRTLCVEPDQNMSCLLPSNRIGSNFTTTAAFLMAEKYVSHVSRSTQGASGLVFIERSTITTVLSHRKQKVSVRESEQRYFEYLSDKLIDHCYLAPLSASVETRVVLAAVKRVFNLSGGHVEKVVKVAHQEFVDNYYMSGKKAILNYLLMRTTSCERLGIPFGVPNHALLPAKWKWGSSDGPNGSTPDLKALVLKHPKIIVPTTSYKHTRGSQQISRTPIFGLPHLGGGKAVRRKRVQSKLMSLLELSNPQVRTLRYMWHDLQESISLVDLPSTEDLNETTEPMDILQFEKTQLAFSAKMKAYVMEKWYLATKSMFETAIGAETYSVHTSEAAVKFRLRHLFDTVAAIMSLQIRSLIMTSVQAYVNFFELFGEVKHEGEGGSSSQMHQRPVYSGLLTTLALFEGQIQFRDPLVDIPSRLLNVLHNIPKLFYNLGRIETQFELPLQLHATASPFLWNVAPQEDDIVDATIRIRTIIEHNISNLKKLQAEYDTFALTHRYVNAVDCFHLEENNELDSYRTEMERVQATAMRLAIDNRHSQHLGLFSVDCRHVNTKLHADLAQWMVRLLEAFEQRTGRMNAELRQEYKEIAARLAKKPLDLYELVDAEAFVQNLKTIKLQELQNRGGIIKQRLRFLLFERETMHVGSITFGIPGDTPVNQHQAGNDVASAPRAGFRLSTELLSSTAKTVKWHSHIEKLLKEAESQLVNERARIETMFIAKRSRFQAELEEFEGEVRGFAKKGDLRHAATYVVQLAKIRDNMFIFRQAMETISNEEQKLQWKPTDFGKLDDIAEEMAPYEQLWKTVREFREMNSRWLRGNVFELPGKEGLQALQQMLLVVANVSSVLLQNSAAAAITAETVRKQMTDFRENVRLIVAIQNPAMKERHIKEVSRLIGLDFSSGEPITLLKLLENGAFELVRDVVDISSNATQEEHIERALHEIEKEWDVARFRFVASRHPIAASGVLSSLMLPGDAEACDVILDKACAENILSLVEDHLLRLQTLSCLAHAGPFVEEMASWQKSASEIGQLVELLKVNEDIWRRITPLYLAGIAEIKSEDANPFGSAVLLFRSTHAALLQEPACKELFTRGNTANSQHVTQPTSAEALISGLEECQLLLESVKCDIQVGFETKRSSFGRFYFLSDAELVSALSLSKVPNDANLWKSLSKCFPGIHGIQTNVANDIVALVSSMGEQFPLGSPIVTTGIPMPTWLAKLESSMTTILHASIRAASSDLPRKEFRKWCLLWPEQSLVAALQYIWTLESEQANRDPNQRKAWSKLASTLHDNVDAVSKEIRVAAYPHVKATLANMALLLMQLRDVSKAILTEVGGLWIEDTAENAPEAHDKSQHLSVSLPSVAWLAQPRFYFVENLLSVVMMTSTYLPYGFEYLGNGPREILVTPLTLRCFHAIAQAASTMAKGSCLEGEAGTGKSTICYQLARVCGRLYITFECASRKLSFDALENFVKATASSGAWLCIDNFHMMDTTSISVVTMLCSHVMTSLAGRHVQCTLVGDKVRLRRGALFMLTLTPSHQLNTLLNRAPSHKVLLQDARYFFRTVTVQSPDVDKLAEFAFQCGKFVHSLALSKLLVAVLSAYERGCEIMNDPAESTIKGKSKALVPLVVNLRLVNSIVSRATELNNRKKEYQRRSRRTSLLSSDMEENDKMSSTIERRPKPPNSEVFALYDEQEMEHLYLCQALREHLGSVLPSANIHLLDGIIQDFSACNSVLATDKPSAGQRLEDVVEDYVRENESTHSIEFGLKSVQLLSLMRNQCIVVISGDVQTGKTCLYATLSRALTHAARKRSEDPRCSTQGYSSESAADAALAAPTRCVVVCPRALCRGQLMDLSTENHSHTVLAKLVREAKLFFKADRCTQTWLIFDGDPDTSWSEQLLYMVDEIQANCASFHQGLQLSSGKYFSAPSYVRLVIESTSLANATPSFITRVGAVHVTENGLGGGWEHVYRAWKALHKLEFEQFAEEIFTVLDILMAEVVASVLAFVKTNFQMWNSRQERERTQWMLAIFHSSLNQSWKKFAGLTSKKQRNTAVHCLFLQALVWGVGSTTKCIERQKFHSFLYDLILRGSKSDHSNLKHLVTLFFPNGTLVGSTSSNDKPGGGPTNGIMLPGNAVAGLQTFYDYGFSVDFGSKWLRWGEYYNRLVRLRSGSVADVPTGESLGANPNYSITHRLNSLFVPTGSSAAAICLAGQLLLTNYPTVFIGPRDCGKTVCGSAWMLLNSAAREVQSATSSALLETADAGSSESAKHGSEEGALNERVYAGFYTHASDILLQCEPVLQRIRIERQAHSKGKRSSTRSLRGMNEVTTSSSSPLAPIPVTQGSKRSVYIFIDDLQCLNPGQKMDSAIEVLRMLAEHNTMVDPTTNEMTPCHNVVPFATVQVPRLSSVYSFTKSHDLERLVGKFVPVALQALSDSDLCTICETFPSSFPVPSSVALDGTASASSTNKLSTASKDAEQLRSIIIKASLKLFRLLTSCSDFTILQREATFDSRKVHYTYRTAQLFQIVRNICYDVSPTLLLTEKPALARLWCHESSRVLGDSLMDTNELSAFHHRVLDIALSSFGVEDKDFFPLHVESTSTLNQTSPHNWVANELHFSFVGEAGSGGFYRNGYHEVTEMSKLKLAVERGMVDMCRDGPGVSSSFESLEIVLCSYVVKHVLRVSRLLRMGRKAVLLMGARGRKMVTITRLACFLCKKTSVVYRMPQQTQGFASRKNDTIDSNGNHAISAWKTTFRAAILRSVRARDSSIVFIVKDTKLDPAVFPYRTIDQFLGGHVLPSDIIAHGDLDDEILTILRDDVDRERRSRKAGSPDSHTAGSARHQALFGSKSAILEYFFSCVRQNLQIVLILSPPLGLCEHDSTVTTKTWAPILWRYPHILKCSAVSYFADWPPDALIAVAQKCLGQLSPSMENFSATQLSEAAVQLYKSTNHFLSTCRNTNGAKVYYLTRPNSLEDPEDLEGETVQSRLPSSFVQVDNSMLVNHLALFGSRYDQLKDEISANVTRYAAGLEFIDCTASTLESEQAHAALLLPEVQQKTELRRKMSGILEGEKMTADKVTRNLELATTLAATQRERFAVVSQEYEDLVRDSRVAYDKMRDTLALYFEAIESEEKDGMQSNGEAVKSEARTEEIDKEQSCVEAEENADQMANADAALIARRRHRELLKSFVSLSPIPSSIYQLSECLGVILGIEPVEGRDDVDPDEIIMDYWKNIAVALKTPAFWETLIVFDVPSCVTEKMVGTLLPVCTAPDFDKKTLASVHEIAGVLCEWVQRCVAFAQDFILARPKSAQLQREQDLLKQAEGQVVKRKMELYTHTTSSEQASEKRNWSELERQRADEKLQDTTSLLHLTSAAWKVLSTTREKWKRQYECYFEFAKHWVGDLMLATAAVAYTSYLEYPLRLRLYQLWIDAMALHSIVPSPKRRSLHEVFRVRQTDFTKLSLNGLPPRDESALENAVIVLHTYYVPLLIDPYGVALDWLKKHHKSTKLSVVSANVSSTDVAVWSAVQSSIKHEATLILTDICRDRMKGLQSFLGAKRRSLFDAINRDISANRRNSGGYRCWCRIPDSTLGMCDSSGVQLQSDNSSVGLALSSGSFEFGADTCNLYLVYTDRDDIPSWMAEYLSQLTIIRFELTSPFVEAQALQNLLESQGRLRELTEIRTLQHDMVACDEQVDGLEDELLEFFSTEKAEHVYADNSKALRIIANRSSVNALENSKEEAMMKVQVHSDSLVSYSAVAKRCNDAVRAWREFNLVVGVDTSTRDLFALSWIWQFLIRAGETSNKSDIRFEELMACFTSSLQQYAVMNLKDQDRLLFRFLLATHIWRRRMEKEEVLKADQDDRDGEHPTNSPQIRHPTDIELLVRLLALFRSNDDRNSVDTCRPTSKSLLGQRPSCMKAAVWSSICYLAEGSATLRGFISRMESSDESYSTWKSLTNLGTRSSSDWQVPIPLDSFTRLCVVSAVHHHRFLWEMEEFTEKELQRMETMQVVSRRASMEGSFPALQSIVTAAAYCALTQAPDQKGGLFRLWRSFSTAKVPIFVSCPPEIDFVDAVNDVAKRAEATMDITDTIQLLRLDEAAFKALLLVAMKKGHWMVLPNLHRCPERLAQLDRIYESLEDGHVHSDFRLWASVAAQSEDMKEAWRSEFENLRISHFATQRNWGTGYLSVKQCLHHSFTILKHELDAFTFASSMAAASSSGSSQTSFLNECEENHIKKLGVFHALITSRDLFPFAQWKTIGEFGDSELRAAIRSLVALKVEDQVTGHGQQNPLNTADSGVWGTMTLRGVIANIYSSKFGMQEDKLLIECCIDLVLNGWPSEQQGLQDSRCLSFDSAQMALPEVAFAIEKLAPIPWMTILNAIPHFWTSESWGPPLQKDALITKGLLPHENQLLWDPHYQRRDRFRKITAQLSMWVANRGYNVPNGLLPAHFTRKMETMPILEALVSFGKCLEACTLQPESSRSFEYHRPIHTLVQHERRVLDSIRVMILQDIQYLEMVSQRGQSLDPYCWKLYEAFRANCVPPHWLELLHVLPCNTDQSRNWTLERFHLLLMGRLNTFSVWQEPDDGLYKLPLDKFRESQYVLEAVHQQFIRKKTGSVLCSPDCLKVMSLFEDSPRLVLFARDDVVYLSGVRVTGHLQLQVLDSKGQRRRSSVSPDGVPVVLQVTSDCLSDRQQTSSRISTEKSQDINKACGTPITLNGSTYFPCPLFRGTSDPDHSKHAELSVRIMTSLPLQQLVFSGSSLQIDSPEYERGAVSSR